MDQNKSHWLWWAIIILAVVLGITVRFYDLTDAPLDFHPTRQLHSALIARGMYYENLKDCSRMAEGNGSKPMEIRGIDRTADHGAVDRLHLPAYWFRAALGCAGLVDLFLDTWRSVPFSFGA